MIEGGIEGDRRIAALVDDLFFQEPLSAVARSLGYEVEFTRVADAVTYLTYNRPALVIVDLGVRSVDWQRWVAAAKTDPATRRIPVLAFGPHTDQELFDRARRAGCDVVVSNGAFKANLTSLIEQHALAANREELQSQCEAPPSDALLRGIHEFNAGAFFEQHETLEAAWRAEAGPLRQLYQGILQVGVAFYQIQRHNHAGALKMFQRAWQYLNALPDACQGVDVAQLRADARAAQTELERLGPARIAEFNPVLIKPVRMVARD
jgi:uncharacterized protein